MPLLLLLVVIWCISEIVLGVVKRARGRDTVVRDRGSIILLWVVIGLSVPVGVVVQSRQFGRITVGSSHLVAIALVLLVVGLLIRWMAIHTLGRLFNTNVALHDDHVIVRRGLYSKIRHPSYAGLLLAFVALGLALGNWLSLAIVVIPVGLALGYRMRVEERALVEAFGQDYVDYMSATRRLVPWVY